MYPTKWCDETQGKNGTRALSTKIAVFFGCKKIDNKSRRKQRRGQTRSQTSDKKKRRTLISQMRLTWNSENRDWISNLEYKGNSAGYNVHTPSALKFTTDKWKNVDNVQRGKETACRQVWLKVVCPNSNNFAMKPRAHGGGGRTVYPQTMFIYKKTRLTDKIRQQLLAMPMPSLGDKSVISKCRSVAVVAACLFLDITAREDAGRKKGGPDEVPTRN